MNRTEFDAYCQSLQATTHVEQWGGASVWKVGGKIFALCSHWGTGTHQCISFKCSDFSYEILCEQEGIVPAPYLARAKWVQVRDPDAMDDDDLKRYLDAAHDIVAGKLTKARQKALGLKSKVRS
ncbi:MAG: MmcQ/YjbR family DNA-binding protein [Alphaproteobacteria bacterium]|nr:MmcQ/YjbR family DNA-binding protein [Alphaproteobacteria bacterium]